MPHVLPRLLTEGADRAGPFPILGRAGSYCVEGSETRGEDSQVIARGISSGMVEKCSFVTCAPACW